MAHNGGSYTQAGSEPVNFPRGTAVQIQISFQRATKPGLRVAEVMHRV